MGRSVGLPYPFSKSKNAVHQDNGCFLMAIKKGFVGFFCCGYCCQLLLLLILLRHLFQTQLRTVVVIGIIIRLLLMEHRRHHRAVQHLNKEFAVAAVSLLGLVPWRRAVAAAGWKNTHDIDPYRGTEDGERVTQMNYDAHNHFCYGHYIPQNPPGRQSPEWHPCQVFPALIQSPPLRDTRLCSFPGGTYCISITNPNRILRRGSTFLATLWFSFSQVRVRLFGVIAPCCSDAKTTTTTTTTESRKA